MTLGTVDHRQKVMIDDSIRVRMSSILLKLVTGDLMCLPVHTH